MKRLLLSLLALSLLFLSVSCAKTPEEPAPEEPEETEQKSKEPTPLRVLSQNLRCADDAGGNSVAEREPRFRKLVEEYQPDLIGTQETTKEWGDYLASALGDTYTALGCSRDGKDKITGEWNTILYKTARFALLESDTFWLSETPDVASAVEGAMYKRICTWALLRDKNTEETILFCNTHLDHQKDEIRRAQVEYLMTALEEYVGKYPTFLTGDFNATNTSQPYGKITETLTDAHVAAKKDETLGTKSVTFHNYGKSKSEIDFVFFDVKFAKAEVYRVLTKQYDGYVSDHYGVLVDFTLKTPK